MSLLGSGSVLVYAAFEAKVAAFERSISALLIRQQRIQMLHELTQNVFVERGRIILCFGDNRRPFDVHRAGLDRCRIRLEADICHLIGHLFLVGHRRGGRRRLQPLPVLGLSAGV